MDLTMTIFTGSLAGIIAMLVVKIYHIKVNRDLFFHGLCKRGDHILKNSWLEHKAIVNRQIVQIKKSAAYFASVILRRWLHEFFGALLKIYSRFTDYVKGKREINGKGEASFYLKNISEHKHKMSDRI